MVLARLGSEVIKIDCCTHPRILGAKRLLQHNLFNGGSPGRMCVARGWRVDCHRRGMIEHRHVTSSGTLIYECEEGTSGTREPDCKTVGFFGACTVHKRAEFNPWRSSGHLDMRSYRLHIKYISVMGNACREWCCCWWTLVTWQVECFLYSSAVTCTASSVCNLCRWTHGTSQVKTISHLLPQT